MALSTLRQLKPWKINPDWAHMLPPSDNVWCQAHLSSPYEQSDHYSSQAYSCQRYTVSTTQSLYAGKEGLGICLWVYDKGHLRAAAEDGQQACGCLCWVVEWKGTHKASGQDVWCQGQLGWWQRNKCVRGSRGSPVSCQWELLTDAFVIGFGRKNAKQGQREKETGAQHWRHLQVTADRMLSDGSECVWDISSWTLKSEQLSDVCNRRSLEKRCSWR